MTLDDYLHKHRLPLRVFAEQLGASINAVHHWRKGQRMPRPAMAAKIIEITGGAVTLPDLYSALATHQSEVAPERSKEEAA